MARGALVNTTIGDYRLDRFLGAGGMGEVYRGVHARLGRAVAVKVLSPEGPGATFVQRFWHEARLHASLHHPNIVELYDFIEHRGQLCIVMEYVDGETLSDRVRLQGPLPLDDAIAVFAGVTAAVAYLHSQGIVHRDIKSANVRLTGSGGAKLLDFGIAKSGSTPALTHAGAVIGTLVYLAPEQLQGTAATPRSDVWALGLLLYEMVTGKLPFKGDTVGELLETIGHSRFERASSLAEKGVAAGPAWRACDRLIARCLRPDPNDRFADAGQLSRELGAGPAAALLAEPEARAEADAWRPTPPPLLDRVLPLLERYWKRVAVGAGVLVVVLLVAVWATRPGPPAPPRPVGPVDRVGPAVSDTPRGGRNPDVPVGPSDSRRSTHRIEIVGGAADVFINGERKGRTPFDYRAEAGETVHLELREEGFVTVDERFDITTRPVWTFVMKRAEGRRP